MRLFKKHGAIFVRIGFAFWNIQGEIAVDIGNGENGVLRYSDVDLFYPLSLLIDDSFEYRMIALSICDNSDMKNGYYGQKNFYTSF